MAPHTLGIALQTLLANPLRTVLSTLGVVIGVASLVAILSLGDGLQAFALAEIEKTTDLQVITVAPVTTDRIEDVVVRRSDYTVFTHADERDLALRLGAGVDVGLSLSYASFWSAPGDTARAQAIVTAATPGFLDIVPFVLLAGRALTADDVAGGARVAIISRGMAGVLAVGRAVPAAVAAAPEHAVGRELRIGDVAYRVIGVAAGTGTDTAVERVGRIALPLAPTDALPGLLDVRAPTLAIRTHDVTAVPAVRAAVESWLGGRWTDAGDRFAVASNVQRVAQAQRGILVFKAVMAAITGISLLVGGIGIMNVLLASITERTREIGVRRATGARRRDIRQQFLAESIAIAALGSGLGLLLGIAGSHVVMVVVGRVSNAPVAPVFTWESMALAVVAALVVGLTFGMYPAVRAGNLSPIEALRHE
jgi:putative ABC transport system permease protein